MLKKFINYALNILVEIFVIWLDLYLVLCISLSVSSKYSYKRKELMQQSLYLIVLLAVRGIRNLTKKGKFFPFSSSPVICVNCTEEIPVAETANECVIITGSQHS